jgi:SAM-dependent methyltransferase
MARLKSPPTRCAAKKKRRFCRASLSSMGMGGDFLKTYPAHVARLRALLDRDAAFSQAVGGNFLASGKLQYSLLVHLGLDPKHLVIDVGCGSGRLAAQLAHIAGLRYLGTDVVPDLLEYARTLTQRPDWRFLLTDGVTIPAENESADFVSFFSVFTHLRHEESCQYLAQARRVLRPGGLIVFSFLEFRIRSHWAVFEQMLLHGKPGDHLNQFMDRDGIHAFADYLGLNIEKIWDGAVPHIPFEGEVLWDDGRVQRGLGDVGHSIAVLRKPA